MKTKIEHESIFAEMAIQYKTKKNMRAIKMKTSKDVYEYLKSIWNNDTIEYQEQSVVILLNKVNNVIGWKTLSVGGTDSTIMDVKIIYSTALLSGCSAIILSHNHPSGNLKPSESDISCTKKIVEAGQLFDISVLDHIINNYLGWFFKYVRFRFYVMFEAFILLISPIVGLLLFALIVNYLVNRIKSLEVDDPTGKSRK